ncbi:hypothetical protein [Arenimonas terrae]|uniref:Uncharacterized protein n=1 Tax=Arenimonas terrae TaxID=2546226 RepID=A0A5C4RT02_9GAMM|nr:hypothetical protein [Arenimonas terrae]TNJ34336.1 hypothetical protein E1B00_00645 [Arenimonas terrae]
MKRFLLMPLLAGSLACTSAPARAATDLETMPAGLETRFALSALPPGLRDGAAVYLLDPATGYRLAKKGNNGQECLVQRTVWELGDFRDDIYFPLCYDAAGASTYLKVIRDAAALRAEGLDAAALKAVITRRWQDKTYAVPSRPGLSYMLGPIMRTAGPPDMAVHTMAMPHLMFYAPHARNEDIGAAPDLTDPETLRYPFVDRQGIGEQSYFIQMMGESEKAGILAAEAGLVKDLCEYRKVLCLGAHTTY